MIFNQVQVLNLEMTSDAAVSEVEIDDESDYVPPSVAEFFKSPGFYKNAQEYWSRIPPSIDGMLGGLSVVDRSDIDGSSKFLRDLFKMKPSPASNRALDCGAGIGRVTKNLLVNFFNTVDLVEQDENFARQANEYLSNNGQLSPKVGNIFNVGLQDFTPTAGTYDVIWCQWVLGHLTDADLALFFQRCSSAIAKNGCIIIKENFTSNDDDFCIDAVDSSVTRSVGVTKKILDSVNLRIVHIVKQENFIKGLFPVYTIACKPNRKTN